MPLLRLPGAGASLYFEDAGRGDGYPVVFMHPASGCSQSWRYQLSAFAANGLRCITYDLRNWGRSQPDAAQAAPVDSGCFSDDLQLLAEHLGLQRFALVGAAYGGFGALDYAVRFPERLSALVLSATQAGLADPTYTQLRERVVSPPIRALPLELRELGPSYRARDPAGVAAWLEIAHAAGEPPTSARQRMHRDISLADLETLQVPTLLLAGGADLLAPPELMRYIVEHLPNQRFVTLGAAGHCLHWEEPAEWNRLVLEFLQPLVR